MANLSKSRKNKYHIIYKTTNLVNNKIYIGAHSTNDIADGYIGSGKMLHLAIKKYGLENFKREVLHMFNSPEEMFEKETEIVNEEFIGRSDVYNIVTGGFGGFNKGSTNLRHITNVNTREVIAVDKVKLKEFLNNGWRLGGAEPSNKGKVYIYKDNKRLAIKSTEIDNYLNEGWQLGYTESPTKGKIWIYSEIENRYTLCEEEDLEDYINQGWIRKKWAPAAKCWINKNGINKRVPSDKLQDYFLSGWKKGRISSKKVKNAQRNHSSKRSVCPHCKKEGQYVSMSRWHFDNCRHRDI